MMSPSLVAVGDISFGDNAVTASIGIDSLLRRQPRLDMFEHVHDLLQGHDLVFGNLESVLSDRGHDAKRLSSRHMRGRPVSVTQLANAGFNVINIANNHILQHGETAFAETVQLLQVAGIATVGLAGQRGWHCEPARLVAAGRNVVFLGYAFEKDKYYHGAPLYAQTDLAGVVADIRRAKTRDNLVVCSFHWGREFISYPSLEQIAIGRGVVDAGCDLVLGHHPHVLNGFEQYKGRYIFYSLGNFLFDQVYNEDCRRTMAVRLHLLRDGAELAGTDPLRIRDDYRPAPDADPAFPERLQQMCHEIRETIRRNGARYDADFAQKRTGHRYRSWLFLLTNLHRYDPGILRQIVSEAVLRRISGVFRTGAARSELTS